MNETAQPKEARSGRFTNRQRFYIVGILAYSIPFVVSLIFHLLFTWFDDEEHFLSVGAANLYEHPSSVFTFLDCIVGLIAILGALFSSRVLIDLFVNHVIKLKLVNRVDTAVSITVFIALMICAFLVPSWTYQTAMAQKQVSLSRMVNEVNKGDTVEIEVKLVYRQSEMGWFFGRDYRVYEIVNVSTDVTLKKVALRMKYIRKEVSIADFAGLPDLHGKMVISSEFSNRFYLMDADGNVLGVDVTKIPNQSYRGR